MFQTTCPLFAETDMLKTSILDSKQKRIVSDGLDAVTEELQRKFYGSKSISTTEYLATMKELDEIRELLHIS